jgi:hypothetical protein
MYHRTLWLATARRALRFGNEFLSTTMRGEPTDFDLLGHWSPNGGRSSMTWLNS